MHTDDMNDLVLMGLARDAAEAEVKALRARVQELAKTLDGIWRYAVDTAVCDHDFRGWAEVETRTVLQKQEGEE